MGYFQVNNSLFENYVTIHMRIVFLPNPPTAIFKLPSEVLAGP